MTKFQFECGEHKGMVEAPTLGEAWRKLTKGQKKGFAPLARYAVGRPGEAWHYITPEALDRHE